MESEKAALKVASILDVYSYACFKYEAEFSRINKSNWTKLMEGEMPDLLLVESAWQSNINFFKPEESPDKILYSIVNWCRENKIPTVFWNKEDPVSFDYFIHAAKLFDHVFTTDEDCIPRYKEILGHQNVYLLPFGAQPKIHNPVDRNREKLGRVAFAGSWYKKYLTRQQDAAMLFNAAIKHGLHIYDRWLNYKGSNEYKFPDIYRPYIVGGLSYDQMVSVYKKYDVFLNVNIVTQSPSMFSRRVFELLSSGTNLISSYSAGIEKNFADIVRLCKTGEEAEKHLNELLNNKELRDRLSLFGQREVMSKHTYRHRFESILEKAGLGDRIRQTPGGGVITLVNHESNIENVLSNYTTQSYSKKALTLVLDSSCTNRSQWEEICKDRTDISICQVDTLITPQERFTHGVEQSEYEYVALFNSSDYYAPEFLNDCLNTFEYTEADMVGKGSYCAFLSNGSLL